MLCSCGGLPSLRREGARATTRRATRADDAGGAGAGASIYTTPAPEVPHGLAVIKVHGVASDMVSKTRVDAMLRHYPNKRHYKIGEVEMMKMMMNVSDECGFPFVRPVPRSLHPPPPLDRPPPPRIVEVVASRGCVPCSVSTAMRAPPAHWIPAAVLSVFAQLI